MKEMQITNMKSITRVLWISFMIFISSGFVNAADSVYVEVKPGFRTAKMSNGLIDLKFDSYGRVYSLRYDEIDLIGSEGKSYFSYYAGTYYSATPSSLRLVRKSRDLAEIVYSCNNGPLKIDMHYVMLSGVKGFYCFAVLRSLNEIDNLEEVRYVFRLDPNTFTYGYVAEREGSMVAPEILKASSKIQDATYRLPDGSLYTKYDWATYVADDSVHGVWGDDFGTWVISASDEYLNGGPLKQELMVESTTTTPIILKMLQGAHFGAGGQQVHVGWEKLYGPFLFYVNKGDKQTTYLDAQQKASEEIKSWPYHWMDHPLFPLERSMVSGRLVIGEGISQDSAMVVLAQPDEEIYRQGKEYIFWTETDSNGYFTLPHVRPGQYTLYAYTKNGIITDELVKNDIQVNAPQTDLGDIQWDPPAYDHVLWSIGKADRMSGEFKFGNLLRQYGLWNQVPENLTYRIGSSREYEDWYYAQTQKGSWDVVFDLERTFVGEAVLTMDVASAAHNPTLDVYVNGESQGIFSFENDPTIYRSALRGGRYRHREIRFPAQMLHEGSNTITFNMISVRENGGLMYDMIKLEIDESTSIAPSKQNDGSISAYSLHQSYPNPFNPTTTIKYNLPMRTHVTVSVYNVLGRKIATLMDKVQKVGSNQVVWDGKDLNGKLVPSGTYIYRIETEQFSESKKTVLLK